MKKLSKNFLKDSYHITELKLSSVRLVDNCRFPWVILIPRRKKITDIFELKKKDQRLLMEEIVYVSSIMKKVFKSFNLNVEKIGNVISQLHVHVIARTKKDDSWPLSVWVVKKRSYSKQNLSNTIIKIKKAF
jgi:diadenosine tetraphosphate (Ap4A) HIT family hydrolase